MVTLRPVARRGFTLLALEFDRTVVGAQAGARGGTAEALAARVRPLVAELIRQAAATVAGPAAPLQVPVPHIPPRRTFHRAAQMEPSMGMCPITRSTRVSPTHTPHRAPAYLASSKVAAHTYITSCTVFP